MPRMTPRKWISRKHMDFAKTQKSTYLENKKLFLLQIKKAYFKAKYNSAVEAFFKVTETLGQGLKHVQS